MKKIFLTVFMLATLILSGCGGQAKSDTSSDASGDAQAKSDTKPKSDTQASAEPAKNVKGDLKVSVLNVGQGDAILIQTGKQTVLIDTSDTDERELLVDELKKFSVTKIDKLILTHPHADHIGSAKALINPSSKELKANPYLEKISVAEVYDNGIVSASQLYKSYTKAAADKGIKCTALKAGDTLDFGNSVKFKVLYPLTEVVDAVNSGNEKSDPNNESVVGKLTYKKFSMMLTGDAERKVESEIWADNDSKDLKCDMLKAGHHGSKTSSTDNFIKTVAPSYVLISCGPEEDRRNTYGHPHLAALQNYLAEGVDKNHIYCTRWNGTITVVSDGKDFSVTPERKEDWLDKWMAQNAKK